MAEIAPDAEAHVDVSPEEAALTGPDSSSAVPETLAMVVEPAVQPSRGLPCCLERVSDRKQCLRTICVYLHACTAEQIAITSPTGAKGVAGCGIRRGSWEMITDPENGVYYYCYRTQESSWAPPPAFADVAQVQRCVVSGGLSNNCQRFACIACPGGASPTSRCAC
jgi:hypothetical protein